MDTGIIRIPSRYSVTETLQRLESLLIERGVMIFARIDFSDAARGGSPCGRSRCSFSAIQGRQIAHAACACGGAGPAARGARSTPRRTDKRSARAPQPCARTSACS